MRRGVFLVLAALAAGCAEGSTIGDPGGGLPAVTPTPPAVTLASGSATSMSDAERARSTGGSSFLVEKPLQAGCRANAFCDDFEDATPGARWTSTTTAASGAVDFIGPSSSFGERSLRATTDGAASSAYLTLAHGTLGSQWVGVLGFSMRLDALPKTVLGGPELAVIDANGGMTRIGFSVRPEGIALHQYFASCAGAICTSRSDLVADVKPGEWHRLVVAVETYGLSAGTYGRIEVTVDGGELIVLPLAVTPFDGALEVHAGITVGDDAPAAAHVDDILFYTH